MRFVRLVRDLQESDGELLQEEVDGDVPGVAWEGCLYPGRVW
jgi:hypothetical protein